MNKKQDIKIDALSKIDDKIVDEVSVKRFSLLKILRKKAFRNRIISITSAAAAFLLVATSALVVIQMLGKIPVYTGMTVDSVPRIEHSESAMAKDVVPLKLDALTAIKPASLSIGIKPQVFALDNGNGNAYGHDKNNKNEAETEVVPNATSNEIAYFTQTGKDIYITVHIDNPNKYEILSFTLNGEKYSSYMFEDGSDLENLVLKVDVGDAIGVLEYTIDAIKYVDGTEIKDVRMKGDRTVLIGVYSAEEDMTQYANEVVGVSSLSFDFTIDKSLDIVTYFEGSARAVLYDGETEIHSSEIKVGTNNISFTGLESDKEYRCAIEVDAHALDGSGIKKTVILSKTFKTHKYVAFVKPKISLYEISYEYEWEKGVEQKLTALELYCGDVKIRDIDTTATKIDGLNSNTEYRLVAYFVNGELAESTEFVFKTTINNNTLYTVKHYYQNLDNDDYTLGDTKSYYTTEGTVVSAALQTKDGFTSPSVKKVTVATDGSSLVEYYYTRNSYTISYVTNGGESIAPQSYKYEQPLNLATLSGDKFIGWQTSSGMFTSTKMPASNITLYAYWKGEIPMSEFNYSGTTLTQYTGSRTDIVISEYIGGQKITTIGNNAFAGRNNIQSVSIPDSVTTIGSSAFSGCTGLTSVTIPDSVESIGYFAFSGCTGLTSVTITNSVTSISTSAFEGCPIESATIPATAILSIKNNNLKEVVITSGTSISNSAFKGCTSLTSVTIPNSVTSIGSSALRDCTSLQSITIPDSVTTIDSSAFSNCPIKYATIPAIAIPSIKNNNLKEVVITSGTSISKSAFNGCTGLTSVTIPDSVRSIGDFAFNGCTGLTSVTIPDSVTSIGDYAFSGCTSLTSITIPNGVTRIGYYAFNGCESIQSVYITDIGAWCGIYFDKGYANPLYFAKNLYLNGELVTDMVIPDGVESIGAYAFLHCTSLESITIPNSVKSIGNSAFDDCTSLASVTIPDSVKSIGIYAFSGCTSLTSVYYHGTEAEWNQISISSTDAANTPLTSATRYYYSETQKTGNYWRYVDGVPTKW